MNYQVSWSEIRSVIIDADSKEDAEEKIKNGEFDNNDVQSIDVNLASLEAVSEDEAIPE